MSASFVGLGGGGGVGSAASRSLNDPESVAASLGYVTQAGASHALISQPRR